LETTSARWGALKSKPPSSLQQLIRIKIRRVEGG
jgi:hypothetical protein